MFNKSAVTDHIAKDSHAIDWEGMGVGEVADRLKTLRLRQVKEATRISPSPHIMNRDLREYNLSNIYVPLFSIRNQSSCKQSKSRGITRSKLKSEDGSG